MTTTKLLQLVFDISSVAYLIFVVAIIVRHKDKCDGFVSKMLYIVFAANILFYFVSVGVHVRGTCVRACVCVCVFNNVIILLLSVFLIVTMLLPFCVSQSAFVLYGSSVSSFCCCCCHGVYCKLFMRITTITISLWIFIFIFTKLTMVAMSLWSSSLFLMRTTVIGK